MASMLRSQVLACQDASELAGLGSCVRESMPALDWAICMVHRISLNDPTVEELDLAGMRLTAGEEKHGLLPKLCSSLAGNTHLRKLRLSNVGLRAGDVALLATALCTNQGIRHIDIEANQLTNLRLLPLVNAAGSSQTLEELRLSQGAAVREREFGQALVAALRSNRMLVKISIEICDAPLRTQADTEMRRNADAARRRRQAARSSTELAAGHQGRSELDTRILACSTVAQMADLAQQEPERGTKTWLTWMVHRLFLNDPSLTTFDATLQGDFNGDPVIFPKLAVALAKNTHLESLLLSRSGFREAEALAASLQVNRTLRTLDIDRTRLSSLELILIANAVASSCSLVELRCNSTMDLGQGHKAAPVWQAMVNAVKKNTNLCKLVLDVGEAQYRNAIQEQLARNNAASWNRKKKAVASEVQSLLAGITTPAEASDGSKDAEAPETWQKYLSTVAAPAERTFSREELCAATGRVVEVLPGRCWVVPCTITPRECDEWIHRGAEFGLEQNYSATKELRSNTRTKDFVNTAMARLLRRRLPNELIAALAASSPGTEVCSVYEELRVTQYTVGQLFRPHCDDSVFRPEDTEYGKRGETSTHTVLAVLSEDFEGGATRFWPTGRYKNAVDVTAPLGSILVFEQRTLLHEGMVVTSGVKHVAQTGLMRAPGLMRVPDGSECPQPVLFQWGPGLSPF